jgi:hypothetical protein
MIGFLIFAASWGWGTVNFDGWPPERFQVMPRHPVQIEFGRKFINLECGHAQPPNVTEACSNTDTGLIVMPDPCEFPKDDDFARLLCHEVAHLPPNNWPGNHPR